MKTVKDPILLISLVLALAGLLLIYIVSAGSQPSYTDLKDITLDMVGKVVRTSGRISDVQLNPKGHVFLTIKNDNKSLQIALFNDMVKSMNDNGIGVKNLTKGRLINVTGALDIYNNQFQIVPKKAGDISVV